MRRALLHVTVFTSLLAAAGCGSFAAGADLSHDGPAWGLDAGARPVLERVGPRVEPGALPGTGIARGPAEDALFIAPLASVDTAELAHGALLDVWLNDRRRDIRELTNERSLGTMVARGDFFRYNTVNSDPDLRGLWGQGLLLKWSALLEITERGPHVFMSELAKERSTGAYEFRTLVRVNDETVFERGVRVNLTNTVSELDSRVLTLAPGFYRLEVWLAASGRPLDSSTQLGTYLKIRAPGVMTAEPLQSSRVWHRTG
ncbi:MAG TPA: hypothetical protein VFT45_12055 [Longimicrobium sp.]|nr:hypothetical protein [Longimicrobium sp.]